MTIYELFKEFSDSTRDRLKNPLVGAFGISWLIINWRIIVILLFSEKSIEGRIDYIEDNFSSVWLLGAIPLAFSFLYTVGLPWVMLKVDGMTRKNIEGRTSQWYSKKEFVIDKKIFLAKKERVLEDEKSGNRTMEELNSKIAHQTSTIESLGSELKLLRDENANLIKSKTLVESADRSTSELSQTNAMIRKDWEAFKMTPTYNQFLELIPSLKRNETFPANTDEMKIEKLVVEGIVDSTGDVYTLTPKGVYYWKEYVKDYDIPPF